MREIKFRAYDIYSNDLISVKTIDLEADGSIGCIVDHSNINLDVNECVLMQLVSNQDVTGVGVFDGDIITFEDNKEIYFVVFDEEREEYVALMLVISIRI